MCMFEKVFQLYDSTFKALHENLKLFRLIRFCEKALR